MKINKLPKEVYDLIAAGEVILAPVSVVKELVENALDAEATRIIVETVAGGIERIRVIDNGSGIERDDIELAFAPHATSKLKAADELFNLETLGFRGEALASIAVVANVTMVTKTAADELGTRARAGDGSELSFSSAGADTGTDVVVEQIFHNIPARKKHLGDARAEGRKIVEYLSKMAVCRPDIGFRLISDGALVFATLGNGDRLAAIAAVYGSRAAENLVPLLSIPQGSTGAADMRVSGYVSGVLGLRGNRKSQHFFVNGRPVSNGVIEAAVGRAYREFAEPGRFPVVFLLLSIDPAKVDVNVHPAKNEITFENPNEVSEYIYTAIRDVLYSSRSIPKLAKNSRPDLDPTFHLQRTEDKSGEQDSPKSEETLVSTSGGSREKIDIVDINKLLSTTDSTRFSINPDKLQNLQDKGRIDNNILQSTSTKTPPERDSVQKPGLNLGENADAHYAGTLNIAELRVLTTLFATYILAAENDTIYLIDQHAAHERVNFERFKAAFLNGKIEMQGLLTPYLFTPPATVRDLSEYVGFFLQIGFEIDEFGNNTWAARTFPAFVPFSEGEGFLLESLAALGDEPGVGAGPAAGQNPGRDQESMSLAMAERIMMRACKASVKANRTLTAAECENLLSLLSNCDNPFTCPHGRPVFLKLTRQDIERLFKRA